MKHMAYTEGIFIPFNDRCFNVKDIIVTAGMGQPAHSFVIAIV